MSIEVGTGQIKAMVGGRGEDHFNRAVQMVRQPGSAFKPFVYVTAFENKFEPSDLLSNEKKTYAGGWTPKNYRHVQDPENRTGRRHFHPRHER